MNPEIFIELTKILAITFFTTGIIKFLKQPAIIGYILSGIIAGPVFFNIIDSTNTFSVFSHIGIALLLFFVGLNLNLSVIKNVGKISLITGLGQVIFTILIGFLIINFLGFSIIPAIYIAVGLAFSSTIVIMKLLSDKKDLDTLYGRISVGFLIVQDFIAIFILLIISSITNEGNIISIILLTILKGIGSIIVLFLVTLYVLPKLMKTIAKSQEFLLLFSITWCFLISCIFYYLNFSIEAGALLAGVSLSMFPYHFEISSKLKPLRDFFLILFFVMLGSEMIFSNILDNLGIIIGLSLFVLIGNPIIVMTLMGRLGYTKRNSFLSGLTVAQISEFSLIIITMGVSVGHVSAEILSLVTVIALITFVGSSYMILNSNNLYKILSKYLKIFEKKGPKKDEHRYHKNNDYNIVLFGYNRIGFDILETLKKIDEKFLIIDYDPEIITKLSKQGFDCMYGDANDSELLNDINFRNVQMIISTIPIFDTNSLIINKVKELNKNTVIAVVSHQIDEAERLYEEGATYVIMPHFLGGKHFSTMIENNKLSIDKYLEEKIEHIENLHHRKHIGHKHPEYHHK